MWSSPVSTDLSPADLDRYAETYYLNAEIEDVDIEELAQQHSVPMIIDAIGPVERVLEMGYGTGLITRELLAAGVPVEVVEGSPALREHALAQHPDLQVHLGMFESFVPEQPFDAVLALHVLEHVDRPGDLLSHVISWVKPGGVLVAVTPNARSIHRMLGVAMGLQEHLDDLSERDHLVGHQRVYDLAGLTAELAGAGLEVIGDFGYFVKPLANSQMLGWPRAVLDGLNAISGQVPSDLCGNIGVVARRA
jgi:2-polyprenyl-3-methyl-5-hydroxy-6-metoxy-1,4-benzoquinol methylase